MTIELSDFLKNKRRPSGSSYITGQCKICEEDIPWKNDRLLAHKTNGNCSGQENSEREVQ